MVVEAGRFTRGVPDGGFDLQPFEANSVIAVDEQEATIGPAGFVDVPTTLTRSGAQGGLNHLVAVVNGADGATGRISNRVILELAP